MKAILLVALLAIASVFARAPVHLAHPERVVKDSYIIVLHNNVTADLRAQHLNKLKASSEFAIGFEWSIVNGYSATITSKTVLDSILEDERVSYLEQDAVVSLNYVQEEAAANGVSVDPKATEPFDSVSTQNLGSNAAGLWGLTRIWQKTRSSTTTYQYWASAGKGVDAYIVDTGINSAHTEFTGRIVAGASYVTDTSYPGTADGNGHGTHVSSTTAGTTYGVAKLATIIPVKVLSSSGSGTNAGVISGVNYVSTTYGTRKNPSVANLSLGGSASTTLDTAVNNAVAAGVTFVVAAGNENQDACNTSPARATSALTVGSTTNTDARSSFSNYGTCVDIFAPGSNILGAWYTSSTATSTISGTSMASPHVAGGVALYLGRGSASAPATVKSTLNSRSTTNVITSPGTGSPNRLLFTSTTA